MTAGWREGSERAEGEMKRWRKGGSMGRKGEVEEEKSETKRRRKGKRKYN